MFFNFAWQNFCGNSEEARLLITDDEIKAGKAKFGDTPTIIFSRAVERIEEELMSALSSYLKEQGWITSSLIHDEITILHPNRFISLNEQAPKN